MLKSVHRPSSVTTNDATALIMLHGRGADEYDLFGLTNMLDPRLDIHSLRAPYEFEWGGYAWFHLFDDGSADEEGFRKSRDEILSFIAALKTKNVFLLGFSMGAMMSYAVALTKPHFCKGIAALSGFAPAQIEREYRLGELDDLHIFISHGINDPVIPVASARNTKELLTRSTADVTYNEYRMGHEISPECLADLTAWMQRLL